MVLQDQIIPYLLDEGLIDAKSLVRGDTFVVETSRRHHTYNVLSKSNSSYFIKHGTSPDKSMAISQEATVYRFFQNDTRCLRFCRFIPAFVKFDADRSLLIINYIDNASSLREFQIRKGIFNLSIANEIGRSIRQLHSIQIGDMKPTAVTPWVLTITAPDTSLFHEFSNNALQLVRTVQLFSAFEYYMTELKQTWEPTSIVHFDLKSDNILVRKKREIKSDARIQLIDWELATIGDPCWDVGCIFSDYLSFWLLSMVYVPGSSMKNLTESARYPLKKIQPAIRAFWRSYASGFDSAEDKRSQFLVRSIQFAAVRLVQTILEQARMNQQMNVLGPYILQLSLNMLKKPSEASGQILGIFPEFVNGKI